MRAILYTVIVLLTISAASAQEADSIATFPIDPNNEMKLSIDSNRSGVAIDIAGYNITLVGAKSNDTAAKVGNKNSASKNTKVKADIISNVRLGFNALSSPNYEGYSAEDQGFLELKGGRSIMFSLDVLRFEYSIANKRLLLGSGLGLTTYNYTFADDITIIREDGVVLPETIDESFKKSKLRTTYATLPISLSLRVAPKLYLQGSLYAGVLLNSVTKYKDPISKEWLGGVNPLLFGTTVKLQYKGVGIFWSYNVSTLFESGSGPDTRVSTIGISLW
ncbi:MAG: hypothetical protein R3Y16_07450 [Rikenellaceae bacterium]